MQRKSSRSRTPDWLRTSFWREVEAELGRIEPLDLARFTGAGSLRPPARRSFERELWQRLKGQLPV